MSSFNIYFVWSYTWYVLFNSEVWGNKKAWRGNLNICIHQPDKASIQCFLVVALPPYPYTLSYHHKFGLGDFYVCVWERGQEGVFSPLWTRVEVRGCHRDAFLSSSSALGFETVSHWTWSSPFQLSAGLADQKASEICPALCLSLHTHSTTTTTQCSDFILFLSHTHRHAHATIQCLFIWLLGPYPRYSKHFTLRCLHLTKQYSFIYSIFVSIFPHDYIFFALEGWMVLCGCPVSL